MHAHLLYQGFLSKARRAMELNEKKDHEGEDEIDLL